MSHGRRSVLIADTQYLVTETLIHIIRESEYFDFIGLAKSKGELLTMLAKNPATDLIITDIHLIHFSRIEDLQKIERQYPGIKILILTNQIKVNEINELNRIGIKNIIYKTSGYHDILHAIDLTLKGKKFYSDEVLDLLLDSKSERDEVIPPALLTPTETEITKLIANGMTTKEIASRKHVSFHTIMSHRKNIFRKLNVKNRSELTMYAVKAGLIDNIEYYI